ncbi:protein ZNRD2 [Protopterus annectens]|uniref:protein ZNRD2 n=1 Tax=Protopterus annectens TaxID=7888 RepID=UPI001CF96021|nr:protein ZNRD2 [Protopterus annectens]
MLATADDDYNWEPPSEAEMKVIQARRERQDKISKLMGDYLLKGYKMLGECCGDCGTILLQDKQKKNYCVACQELDSDIDKDNPALNPQAALSQVRERQLASSTELTSETPEDLTTQNVPRPEHCEGAATGLKSALPAPAPSSQSTKVRPPPVSSTPTSQPVTSSWKSPSFTVLEDAEEAVLQKITWATRELQHTSSVESSIQLCNLIRSCTESLRGIRDLSQ